MAQAAVQFGAGNIGRGLMGQLLFETGYHTTFIDTNKTLVEILNKNKIYTLKLLDGYSKKEVDLTIKNFSALTPDQCERVNETFAGAGFIGTAVGVRHLNAISAVIADGIRSKYKKNRAPVDIFLCENSISAARDLKQMVLDRLDSKEAIWAEENIGFVGTSVARLVPAPSDRFKSKDPALVVADAYSKLPYDALAIRAGNPSIKGMYGVDNFEAEVKRKLFTHNLGHAVMGYLGYLKGYSYVHETFSDDYLLSIFESALNETSRALIGMFQNHIDPNEQREIVDDIRIRFANPMIMDTVQRVARDPIRKLGPEDRLIGSIKLCMNQGIFPENIAFVCGAALCYDYPEDKRALELQKMISKNGPSRTLEEITKIKQNSNLALKIIDAYNTLQQLKKEWHSH